MIRNATPARGPADLPAIDPRARSIVEIGRAYGLRPLRATPLASGDLELRVWHGFVWRTNAVVLRRRAGVWSASRSAHDRAPGERFNTHGFRTLRAPRSGWAAVWRSLDARGVRTIPDEAALPSDGIGVFDGVMYVFEIRRGGAYRAYSYANPASHPGKPGSARVAGLVRILARAMPAGAL